MGFIAKIRKLAQLVAASRANGPMVPVQRQQKEGGK